MATTTSRIEAKMRVPFVDLKLQHAAIRGEVDQAVREVLDSAYFTGGPNVVKFEEEFSAYCHTRDAVAVNSGTDAVRFALLALGVGFGDEVITVPNTFIATTEAISQTGATPVFVDITPDTYTMDVSHIVSKLGPRTKAILPVHLYGQMADMEPILELGRRHGIPVVEDACQAHGAEYERRCAGSLGIAGCFSFYPAKNLGCCGEGGAVTTNDPKLAERIRMLRDHGQSKRYHHDIEGYNGRLDAIQCAILRVKLRHLDSWNESRRRKAALYDRLFANCPEIIVPVEARKRKHVYHLYVVRLQDRERARQRLAELGVETGLHYPIPLHQQKAYVGRLSTASYPVTEDCACTILSLPMFPELTDSEVQYVAESLKRAVLAA